MLDLYVITDVIFFVVKHKSLKLREDSVKVESYFVAFTSKEVENPKTTISPLMSTKAIAIQALSPKKYIVLDSDGSLHLLLLSNSTHGPEITVEMRQLICSMKVQKLAVHPDISLTKQTLWISDGYYSVHMMEASEPDTDDIEESNTKDFQEKLMQTSVTQAIFVSERILDIVTVGADAILILGEGRLFAYAIS